MLRYKYVLVPESDTDEPFEIFTDVRDSAIGKVNQLFHLLKHYFLFT